MERDLLCHLEAWKKKSTRLPLLLRGARQVGKTFLVEEWGKRCFHNCISINFEASPEYINCFGNLKPAEIVNKITIMSGQAMVPGETLLFLDEIQACPNAIMALRYFKEQCPTLHIIGAGSLLEFALRAEGMRMPVGRIQYLYLKPVSFQEYLRGSGNTPLLEYLHHVTLDSPIPDAIHHKALALVREYMAVGGMPMVTASFLNNHAMRECQEYQTSLLKTYSDDFSKYASTARHKYLKKVYDSTPGLMGQQIKYVNISQNMDSRYLKEAIADLSKAGVIHAVHATSASGLPFNTYVQEKKFKLLFLDIGLLKRATRLDMDILIEKELLLLNRGALAEQFVGQELLAYQDPYEEPQLYFWARDKKNSQAEVDYLINVGSTIVPIEVKAGKTGRLKSLQLLLEENRLPVGLRISEKKLEREGNIISIPLYMIHEVSRLIGSL